MRSDLVAYVWSRLKVAGVSPRLARNRSKKECRCVLERAAFKPTSFLFGAFDDETMVGMAGGYIDDLMKRSHIGYLVSVWVEQDYRGQGLATQLCQRVVDQFRATPDISVVQLSVTVGNDDALHIYQQMGFKQWGREPKSISHNGALYDEYHLALEL